MYEVISRRARRGLEEQDLPDLMVIDGGKGQLGAARAALDDQGVHEVELISLAKSRVQGDDVPIEAPDRTDIALMEAASDDLAGAEAVTEMSTAPAVLTDASDVPTYVARSPERVFIAGQKNPVVLRQNSAELFLLTRARDEAHRFAITFHRQLRGKAATRSALDAIPGVGPKRRKMLLRAFGSVARLKAAPFDDVAKVVGAATAKRVLESLA
jgi:excinuclease ABC subunit C